MIELPILNADDAQQAETPAFWRSPRHRDNAEALAKHEFTDEAATPPSGSSRRTFLQLMGASAALTGLSACRPKEQILPFTRKPEEVIPGVASYFATAMPMGGVVQPLIVESHEGRPTKVEGNPEHPNSMGASGTFAQASILNLYDPDRSSYAVRNGQASSWADFVDWTRANLFGRSTARVAVLAEATSSPTLLRLRAQMAQAFPNLRWVSYEAAGAPHAPAAAARPLYRFADARVVVSLDSDFLDPTHPNYVQNTRDFVSGRRVDDTNGEMNRLYAVESAYSLTGGMADNRLRLRAGDIPAFASALAARLGVAEAAPLGSALADHPWVDAVVQDILANRGRTIIVAGESQPEAVHALADRMNALVGGNVVSFVGNDGSSRRPVMEDIAEMVDDMNNQRVDLFVALGTNPVYSLPAAFNMASAIANVPESIHFGEWFDDTAAVSKWHLPRTHYLEAWGDGAAYDGTLSVIQPLIAPLYNDAHSDVELVNLLATGEDETGYNLVRQSWRAVVTGDFEKGWRQVIHDGFLRTNAPTLVATEPATAAASLAGLAGLTAPLADDIEVVVRTSPVMYDGRFSNNAWMLELPDPITKLVWDNVAVMSPATAERLDLEIDHSAGRDYADVIKIAANGAEITLPVWIVPGHADNSISVYSGWNRGIKLQREEAHNFWRDVIPFDKNTNLYRNAAIGSDQGVNVYPILPATGARIVQGAVIEKVDDDYVLISTQDHSVMEGRPIALYDTVDTFRREADFAQKEYSPLEGLEPWDEYPPAWGEERSAWNQAGFDEARYSDYQWGMAIDLQSCTGCNACVVACQSENNIPVVGKEQVGHGREMHWLRIDRYFGAPTSSQGIHEETNIPADPQMVMQPMACVHCEYAPCEQVCPVNATSHSPDGLNEMTYNRCIGTRYCSNNCPYKVRRFNWFNFTNELPLTVQMQSNPNVTVRYRGVMEKCTYCVQRLRNVQREANIADTPVEEVTVQTACQQACPAQAISFGNIRDENSEVMRHKRSPRAYELLAELNVKPRTSYLARVNNPNPALMTAILPVDGDDVNVDMETTGTVDH